MCEIAKEPHPKMLSCPQRRFKEIILLIKEYGVSNISFSPAGAAFKERFGRENKVCPAGGIELADLITNATLFDEGMAEINWSRQGLRISVNR
jgi:hypothetical protein